MARTPEGRVKDAVVKILKTHSVFYFFPATFGMGSSGIPDIVACYKGVFIGIECKAGKNKPTALQLAKISAIIEAGGVAIVVNEENINKVTTMLHAISVIRSDR